MTFQNAEESARVQLDRRNDLSGYVLPVWDPGCVNEPLLSTLRATRRPVAVIDQTGGEVDAAELVTRGGNALLVDALPYQTAGFEVGQALAARGHRRCAFFSLAKTDPQARKCLRGLCGAGPANGAFSTPDFALEGTFGPNSLLDISEKKYGLENAIRKHYEGLKKKLPASYRTHLDPYFGQLLRSLLTDAEYRDLQYSLFDEAIGDDSITCWLTAEPSSACYAHDFLAHHGKRLSIVGFGNSREVLTRRIATWDFNASAGVSAAIEFLLYPHKRLAGQKGHTVQVQGMLHARNTLQTAHLP